MKSIKEKVMFGEAREGMQKLVWDLFQDSSCIIN